MKNAILVILVVAIAGYYGMKFFNRDTFKDGMYRNKEVGFSLDFPSNWNEVDKKDVLGGFGLALEFTKLDTRLFVTPSNPEDAIFIITQTPADAERLAQLSLDDVLEQFKRMGMTVDLKKDEFVGGFDLFRAGGSTKDQYMQIAIFSVEDTLVQLQFHATAPLNRPLRQELENIMGSLSSW